MNDLQLLEALQGVDDKLLRQSEKAGSGYRKWAALAACLCLVTAAALTLPGLRPALQPPSPPTIPQAPETLQPPVSPIVPDTPAVPGTPTEPDAPVDIPPQEIDPTLWSPIYNDTTDGFQADAAPRYDPGAFSEPLTADALASLLPPGAGDALTIENGTAYFTGEGTLREVRLTCTAPISLPDHRITVILSNSPRLRCYLFDTEPTVTQCRGAEYILYQTNRANGSLLLEAEGTLGGVCCVFQLDAEADTGSAARTQFEHALYLFAAYTESPPDLNAITPTAIPQWFDRTLTHAEALADETFGSLMLPEVPRGFATESIRRYKNQQSDLLSGLWTRGYDQLSWQITRFSEADEARVTSVADTRNYDMSLYPIPLAQSVPLELREIVNDPIFSAEELTLEAVERRAYSVSDAGDSQGPRLNFSVRCGEYLIKIRGKGVEPRWIYSVLSSLCKT